MIISSIERIAFNTCCGNFGINLVRGFGTKILAAEQPKVLSNNKFQVFSILTYSWSSDTSTKNVYKSSQLKSVQDNIIVSQLKKRPIRKKRLITDDEEILQPGFWSVKALATAEEYNLEALMDGLITQDLYIPKKINTSDNYRNSLEMDTKKELLPSCMKVPLELNVLEELIERAKDWALMHGMGVRPTSNLTKDIIQFAPFSLLPSVFPRAEFINACEIQPILNTLMHRVAHDYEFLKETLKEIIRVDEFTRRLFEIYETVHNEGFKQKISLGLLRSDLMLDSCCGNNSNDKPFCCWKQVEINTIASGMAWLGSVTTKFHKFILTELGFKNMIKSLPDNNALQGICGGILEAWKLYNDPRAQILFIVEDFTFNICDQRLHEFEIKRQNPNVRVIRRTLTQLVNQAKLGEKNELLVNDKVVSVVYFRCGYEPGQYHSEKEWDMRLLIERSLAIKSPSIQYHLAGTKKVQQALAKPGVVAQYLRNEKTVARVLEIFTAPADVIHAVPKYEIEHESKEIYFFREGTIVMWNIPDLESGNLLQFIKSYEDSSYTKSLVQSEKEVMSYTYTEVSKKSHLKDGDIYLKPGSNFDKYTFSNAISQSVKLGIWEASLEAYIDSIEFVTEDLKAGRKIKMTRDAVLRKQGELFALRHLINLSSDLLDTPDFYWENDELETLYQQTCGYFSIAKRTRVMNEKINHCVELVELLSSHLSDRHHVRLEWMIIILIMVEVAFETLHYVDRYLGKADEAQVYSVPNVIG